MVQNLQNLVVKIINYSFNVEKYIKNEAQYIQSF